MTEIEKNNETISIYMDEKIPIDKFGHNWTRLLEHNGASEIPNYHSSWDWLMPVWFKILEWNTNQFGVYYTQEISSMGVLFTDKQNRGFKYARLFYTKGDNEEKREVIYNSVVEFIKWYNKNKEKYE